MKDRHKYRVWFKYNHTMHDIDGFYFYTDPQGFEKCRFFFTDGTRGSLKLKDFELLQCTGMKDKNGQLIYDGDVVELDSDKRAEVFWNCTGFAIEVHYEDTKDTVVADAYELNNYTVEILGNVYENKELLND